MSIIAAMVARNGVYVCFKSFLELAQLIVRYHHWQAPQTGAAHPAAGGREQRRAHKRSSRKNPLRPLRPNRRGFKRWPAAQTDMLRPRRTFYKNGAFAQTRGVTLPSHPGVGVTTLLVRLHPTIQTICERYIPKFVTSVPSGHSHPAHL